MNLPQSLDMVLETFALLVPLVCLAHMCLWLSPLPNNRLNRGLFMFGAVVGGVLIFILLLALELRALFLGPLLAVGAIGCGLGLPALWSYLVPPALPEENPGLSRASS